jgi:two-component system CheB/CheR fusion protein
VYPERLSQFFRKADDHYQVIKAVRDMCVFAKHDITRDPPFSNLDLLTCRNMLIYMSRALQKTVLGKLHYALKPGGYLVLGASESLSAYPKLFSEMDAKHRFFTKIAGSENQLIADDTAARARQPNQRAPRGASDTEMIEEADRVLYARDGHSGVLIEGTGRILQFRGDTSRYLAPVSGRANFDVLRMVREELQMPLKVALQKARETGKPGATGGIQIPSAGGGHIRPRA